MTLWVALAALIFSVGCNDDTDVHEPTSNVELNMCGRVRTTWDRLTGDADAPQQPCFGDTMLLRLEPNGSGRTADIDIEIPRSGRVRLCLDLVGGLAHQLEVLDAPGRVLAQLHNGDGCIEVPVNAGMHRLRLNNARPEAPDARGHLIFIHPRRDATEGAAQLSSGVLGAYAVTSDCPNCDLRGINFTSSSWFCSNDVTGDCADPNPDNVLCFWSSTHQVPAYSFGNDFSGARFSGAKLAGAQFSCVNFSGAQFSADSQYGPATMGEAPLCCTGATGTTTFINECILRGAAFRNMNLGSGSFTCTNVLTQPPVRLFAPSDLSGADLRGADLSNIDFSVRPCPFGVPTPNPYCYSDGTCNRLDLSNALVDSTTKITNADLSGAALTGWNFHTLDWSTTVMQWSVVSDGDMSGFDFAAPPYAGKFFIADKTKDYVAHADFSGQNFANATFTGLDLSGMIAPYANFTHAILDSVHADSSNPAVFNRATLKYASLQNAILSGSFFRGASLNPANLLNADLSGAWLEDDQTNPPHWGTTSLYQSYMKNTKLNGAHLTSAVLDGVSWYNDTSVASVATGADALLNGASFNQAALPGLDLTGAYLKSAQLTNTQLMGSNFSGADLTNANLSTANLAGANLAATKLAGANLTNAFVDAFAASEIFINVLADPGHYESETLQYYYFAVDRCQTHDDGSTTTTVASTCPDGRSGACGRIACPAPPADPMTTCARWVAASPPVEPKNCTPTPDMSGNIVGLNCSSTRVPAPTATPGPPTTGTPTSTRTPTKTPTPKPGTPTPTPTPTPHPITCSAG